MAARLLCYVALYPLGAGFMDADVHQTPRHCVIGTGKKITLECSQTMGHDNMYWYQQDPGMELQLIHYSYGVNSTEKGEHSSRSTVSRISKEHFPLMLETGSSSQTSSYFCASSDYTAQHRPPQTAQKGLKDAAVTQFPRRKILETKKEVTLQCSQKMNHYAMYWYRQDPGFGLRLIYYSTGHDTIKKGDVPEGYDVSRDELEHFPLTLKSASPNQTSVYFCASSESTAWHGCFLFAQKERQTEVLKIPDPN